VLRGNIRGPEPEPTEDPDEAVEESVPLAVASKADGLQPSGFIGLDSTLDEIAVGGRSAGPAARGLAFAALRPVLESLQEPTQGSRKYIVQVQNTRATTSVMSAPDRSYAAIDRQ